MRKSYESWTVRGLIRQKITWTLEGTPLLMQGDSSELAVVVFDDARHWKVELTLDLTRSRIETLQLDSPGGIGQRDLQLLPLGYLRDAARAYLETVDRFMDDPTSNRDLQVAILEADRDPGEVELLTNTPTLVEFAQEWRLAKPRTINGRRLTRRDILKLRFNKSSSWVDKRTSEARKQGLLPLPAKKTSDTQAPGLQNGDMK